MAALAAMNASRTGAGAALSQYRATFGTTLFADHARARVLANLAALHPAQAIGLLEQSITDAEDLGTLFTWTETAQTWWQYLLARPYARMFHPRRLSLTEVRALCEEMLVGLNGARTSVEAAEHVAVYETLLASITGRRQAVPTLSTRPGLIAQSHQLAFEILGRMRTGLDAPALWRLLHDRRSWLHSRNRSLGDGQLSFGSGIYLVYLFPAVRLAAFVAGRAIQRSDPGGSFMESRIAGQKLVYDTDFSLSSMPQRSPQRLQEMLEPLVRFVDSNPLDERVWQVIGDLQLRVGALELARDALTRSLSFDWSDRITREAALYDMACTQARLGQEELCRATLTQWANLVADKTQRAHAQTDSDLAAVRNRPWFSELFESSE
jgi:hypothetical protein